jgi:hypothetical protein
MVKTTNPGTSVTPATGEWNIMICTYGNSVSPIDTTFTERIWLNRIRGIANKMRRDNTTPVGNNVLANIYQIFMNPNVEVQDMILFRDVANETEVTDIFDLVENRLDAAGQRFRRWRQSDPKVVGLTTAGVFTGGTVVFIDENAMQELIPSMRFKISDASNESRELTVVSIVRASPIDLTPNRATLTFTPAINLDFAAGSFVNRTGFVPLVWDFYEYPWQVTELISAVVPAATSAQVSSASDVQIGDRVRFYDGTTPSNTLTITNITPIGATGFTLDFNTTVGGVVYNPADATQRATPLYKLNQADRTPLPVGSRSGSAALTWEQVGTLNAMSATTPNSIIETQSPLALGQISDQMNNVFPPTNPSVAQAANNAQANVIHWRTPAGLPLIPSDAVVTVEGYSQLNNQAVNNRRNGIIMGRADPKGPTAPPVQGFYMSTFDQLGRRIGQLVREGPTGGPAVYATVPPDLMWTASDFSRQVYSSTSPFGGNDIPDPDERGGGLSGYLNIVSSGSQGLFRAAPSVWGREELGGNSGTLRESFTENSAINPLLSGANGGNGFGYYSNSQDVRFRHWMLHVPETVNP